MVSTIETLDTRPFKHMIMTIGELPSSFVDSMSYYEMLAWLCDYLEKQVVPVVNNNSAVVAELKDYVEHYFDNLDVQEEIDNKLDEMVQSGELQALIANYFHQVDVRIDEQNAKIDAQDDLIIAQNQNIENFKTTINTQVATQDGSIQTLESRMDTFASLEEGSTTGDAELADGRISFDGKTFSSIGANIRNYQGMGYQDLTSGLTKVDGKWFASNLNEYTDEGFEYYLLPTIKDRYYLIDVHGIGDVRQVVVSRNVVIPTSGGSGVQYKAPIVIKGNGGVIHINNRKNNTHPFIGESINPANILDTTKYFVDITANATKVEGKYINVAGQEQVYSDGNYYHFKPTAGKIYRIFSTYTGSMPLTYQQNGLVFPNSNGSFASWIIPNYYDLYVGSDNELYVNEYVKNMCGATFKIYESIMTYAPQGQDILPSVGAFNKAVFIGDSLTYGQTYTANNASYKNYYNYPHYLKDLLDIDSITELSGGGLTTTSWWANFENRIEDNNAVYFVWLGTNDTFTDTVATDCAGDDYTQYANTETGDFGRILGKIKSLTNTKIVMLNTFTPGSKLVTNNKVINDLATKFGAIVIDVNKTIVKKSGYHTAYNGYVDTVHFNNQGHNLIANLVKNQLDSYMNTHLAEFELYKVAS